MVELFDQCPLTLMERAIIRGQLPSFCEAQRALARFPLTTWLRDCFTSKGSDTAFPAQRRLRLLRAFPKYWKLCRKWFLVLLAPPRGLQRRRARPVRASFA